MRNLKGLVQVAVGVVTLLCIFSGVLLANETFLLTAEDVAAIAREISIETGFPFKTIPEIEMVTLAELEKVSQLEQILVNAMYEEMGIANVPNYTLNTVIAGKYSWLTGKIYLVKETLQLYSKYRGLDALTVQKMFVIHEMVHALDDQHSQFFLQICSTFTAEKRRILNALIEGHAAMVTQKVSNRLQLPYIGGSKTDIYSDVNMQAYVFLAHVGQEFIQHVQGQSPLTIVDIYANPPKDSEQLLNPEKYLREERTPRRDLVVGFEGDFIQGLPWQFKYGSLDPVDKLTVLTVLLNRQGDERLADSFESGLICQLRDEVETPVAMRPYHEGEVDLNKGTMILTIYTFRDEKSCLNFLEFCRNLSVKQLSTVGFDESRRAEYVSVYEQFPTIYFQVRENAFIGQVGYLLLAYDSEYVIELLTCGLDVTSDEVVGVLKEVQRRLP